MSDETPPFEKAIDAGLLLPGQYADLVRRNHVIEGELKLLLAVLEDAIRCYLRNVNAKEGEHRRDFVEVRNWFEGNGASAPARRYLQLRESLLGARHRSALPARPLADFDDWRSAVAALPDAPASPALELATCQRSASARYRPLPRFVIQLAADRDQSNCHRVALPWNSPGVASTAMTLRGCTAKIGPMSSTVSTFKSHSYFGL